MSDLAHLDPTPNTLIPPGHAPVKPPVSGVLARWLVTVGEEVAAGQALGEVQREERRSVITAPKAGRVTMLADVIEQPVSSSRIVALVDERPAPPAQEVKSHRTKAATTERASDQAEEPVAISPQVAPAPPGAARKLLATVATPPNQARTNEEPASERDTPLLVREDTPTNPPFHKAQGEDSTKTIVGDSPPKGRRSTIAPTLEIEELTEEEAPPPPPRSRLPKKRVRVVKKTMHPTSEQLERWNALMQRLDKDGYDYSQAELERVAIELFLQLSYADLVEEAEANRDREARGRYGWGNRPI